jgi:predicted transcriptional regulator
MLSPASLLGNVESQNIAESLVVGPKAFWEIRRYLYVCCCSESRASATCDLLDKLVAAGIVVYRGGLFHLQASGKVTIRNSQVFVLTNN